MTIILLIIGMLILVIGYFTYSKYVEKQYAPNPNVKTPAYRLRDNIDFVPMSTVKNMLIQLLNIAGTGPIYGPIMAALFGPIGLILIPVGNIFAGAVMDFGIGIISVRNHGANFPTLAKKYMGK